MAGHSKWANIKHRKEGADKKRGVAFTRVSKEIIVAAKLGGPDPATNARLRIAVSKARAVNMSRDTIERAIKKGTGELGGQTMEELIFEIYGAGGVGIIATALTDKKARTTPEIKSIISKYNANLAEAHSVMRLFKRCGHIVMESGQMDESDLMELVLNAGADDMNTEGDVIEILTPPESYASVAEALAGKSLETVESEVALLPLPGTDVAAGGDAQVRNQKLIDALEEHDDVQSVHHNMVTA